MAFPRISYDGSFQINFPRPPQLFDVRPFRTRLRNASASGESETINVSAGFTVRVLFQNLRTNDGGNGSSTTTNQYLKMFLLDFIYWAEMGNAWTFMLDSAITVNTTLDGVISAGGGSAPVVSATGVTAGKYYAIESKTQVAVVQAASASDPITLSRATSFSFPIGSRLRAFEYLPMIGTVTLTEHTYSQLCDVEITGEVERSSLTV
jgi:hypothetical protein